MIWEKKVSGTGHSEENLRKGGEFAFKIHPNVPQNIIEQLNEEPVFILVDGIPVPFYFTFLQFKGNDKAIVCFENYLNELSR